MTKAERIFQDTYRECRQIIKHHGYEPNSRLNGLVMKDDETVCTRTLNAISKLLKSEQRANEIARGLEAISAERAQMNADALEMVERTLYEAIIDNTRIDLCDLMCN